MKLLIKNNDLENKYNVSIETFKATSLSENGKGYIRVNNNYGKNAIGIVTKLTEEYFIAVRSTTYPECFSIGIRNSKFEWIEENTEIEGTIIIFYK